jgi:Cu/Ag efflux protein CusF
VRPAGLRPAAILGLALTAAVACGPGRDGAASGGPAARAYEVRGLLESLPDPVTGELRIRHEAIPELVGPGGEVEGMAAMSMAFPAGEGLDLSGLVAGDQVRFTLRVDWDAARPVTVTAIEPLPPGTELELD